MEFQIAVNSVNYQIKWMPYLLVISSITATITITHFFMSIQIHI